MAHESNEPGNAKAPPKPEPSFPTTTPPRERWPTSVTIALSAHVAHLRRLIYAAHQSLTEYRWYNPYSYALNFTSLRSSTDTLFFSVWPQASLQWTGPSYQTANDADNRNEQDDAQQENARILRSIHLTGESTAQEGASSSRKPVVQEPSQRVLRSRNKEEKGMAYGFYCDSDSIAY